MKPQDIESGFQPSVEKKSSFILVLKTVFHFICACHHGCIALYGCYIFYNATISELEDLRAAGHFGFAYGTNWNFTFQAIFLLLAFAHDVYEWRDAQETPRGKKIAYWRDIIFQSMVVPYTLFVSSMFWSLYLYDRELVFPKVYDLILPWWFNHCVHTNITIIVAVETVLQARRRPVNLKMELTLTTIIAIAYAIVYYSIFFFAHRWLYNVFGVLTWWQVILYQLLIWTSSFVFYYIQFPINRLIHGSGSTEKTAIEQEDQIDGADGSEQKTEEMRKPDQNIAKNFEISNNLQKTDMDAAAPFSPDNWSLKYRSMREKFENSRL